MNEHEVTFNLVGNREDFLKIAWQFFKAALKGDKEVWFNDAKCSSCMIDGEIK